MTQAVTVRRAGDTFQDRVCSWHVACALHPESPLTRVGFETGPKGLNVVWLEFESSEGPLDQYRYPLRREHVQCRRHATPDSYGHAQIVEPEFANSNARSFPGIIW